MRSSVLLSAQKTWLILTVILCSIRLVRNTYMAKTYFITALLSILPISELRGAIPYAYFNEIPIVTSYLLCVLTNSLVGPIAMFFLSTLHSLLYKWDFYRRIFERTVEEARIRVEKKVEKYGLLGLMFFVAIPLPVTGAWTGAVGAWVLNLDKKKSCLSIALGVCISGIIVSLVLISGSGLVSLFTKKI